MMFNVILYDIYACIILCIFDLEHEDMYIYSLLLLSYTC